MGVALAKGISASTFPGLSAIFLALVSQNQHHCGAANGRAKDIVLGVCCGYTTRSMTHDLMHALIFSMENEDHKGLSCSDLQKEAGCLPENNKRKGRSEQLSPL
jgi:hypothetical protein